MAKVAIGVFDTRDKAESAVEELRNKGFEREISVVTRDEEKPKGTENEMKMEADRDTAVEGVTYGSTLGGLAGLAAGAGALFIPGIGPILAMGPIAGLLSGAVTGGLAGGLIDWGIPAEEGRHYEEDVKAGKTLVAVKCSEEKANDAASVLRRYGAHDVTTH